MKVYHILHHLRFCTLSSKVYKYKTDYNMRKLDLFTNRYLRMKTGYLGKHVLIFFWSTGRWEKTKAEWFESSM